MFTEKTVKRNKKMIRTLGILLAATVALLNFSAPARSIRSLPKAVFLDTETENENSAFKTLTGSLLKYNERGAVTVAFSQSESLSERKICLKLFNLLPLSEIPVYADERSEFYPCGNVIGISIKTKGVLIVGSGSFINSAGKKRCPAQAAGLKPGDIILSVESRAVTTSEELQLALNAFRAGANITVERDGKIHTFNVVPEISENGSAMIGAWVRDSAVGIGTLSFIEKDTGRTAALGHAVVDADTGSLIKVREGEMVFAKVLGVLRGETGEPGELQGTFSGTSERIGSIEKNTKFGIYGKADAARPDNAVVQTFPIAFPDEAHKGKAYILSAVDGEVRKYECKIIRAAAQAFPEPKGLVIEITDEKLLASSGGIVQGMSGSPIIQDDKLIGVVTHVFINDPKKGYGIYAYWMYRMMNEGG